MKILLKNRDEILGKKWIPIRENYCKSKRNIRRSSDKFYCKIDRVDFYENFEDFTNAFNPGTRSSDSEHLITLDCYRLFANQHESRIRTKK